MTDNEIEDLRRAAASYRDDIIIVDQLHSDDQERIHAAMMLLEQVSLITRPATTEEAGIQVET
jgi:hypothetical protein